MNALAAFSFLAVAPVQGFSRLSPVGIGLVIAFVILSLAIHEVAHAWVALQRGDTTARDLGRITLNPIPHIDPVMTIIVPVFLAVLSSGAFIFGGAKPVPVTMSRLKNPLPDMALVALAGPVSNWLLAILFGALYKLSLLHGFYPGAAESYGERLGQLFPLVMASAMATNLFLALFNLLPIPPLDGSRVMNWLLPAPLREGYMRLETIGLFLVVGVYYYTPVRDYLNMAVQGMANLILSWVPA
ncbi:MAG: site-2 protease family protein [Planctomycetes bacterium]|nr:site-2 protease family protein [Planctomycetota bacterium]